MHAPGHRADEAGDLGALALEPEIGQVMALQLPAEKCADAAARKPDASFLPRLCIEHEHVGQEVAQMGRIDVAARRRGALPAQPVPMIEEPSCRRQSQRLLLTRSHFGEARAVRAPKGASKCAPNGKATSTGCRKKNGLDVQASEPIPTSLASKVTASSTSPLGGTLIP